LGGEDVFKKPLLEPTGYVHLDKVQHNIDPPSSTSSTPLSPSTSAPQVLTKQALEAAESPSIRLLNGSSAEVINNGAADIDPNEEIISVEVIDDNSDDLEVDNKSQLLPITETPKRRPKPTTLDLADGRRPDIAPPPPPSTAVVNNTLELPGTTTKQQQRNSVTDKDELILSSPESPSYSQRPLPLSPHIPHVADIPLTSPTSPTGVLSPPKVVASPPTVLEPTPIYSNVKKSSVGGQAENDRIVRPAFLASPEGKIKLIS
jgi:hypothetical protein